ncbi:neuregulin 2b isoform X1 [Tachysurus ichikawai]
MRSQWVWEDERVTLKCEVQGNPSPSFRWLKDGNELRKSKDVKIKTNKKNSKVQISQVRLEDSGNYTCVAENSLGKDNSTSYISVQSSKSRSLFPTLLTYSFVIGVWTV